MLRTKKFKPLANCMLKMTPMRTMATSSNAVEFNVQGTTRTITLNRANKLNALNTQMCKNIIPRLQEYSKSKSANLIVIKSSSEKAFCAGGDIVECAKNNMNGEYRKSLEFFENEYNLNYLLSIYGKPIVSLDNGITMGGAVGLSVHNPFRVVSETTRFAMPESSIGFFNDVGTSFWLPTVDSNLGYYLGITGEELSGYDAFILGFGTHFVPTSRYPALLDRLSNLELKQLSVSNQRKLFNEKSNKEFYALVNSAIEEFSEEIPVYHKFKYSADELNTIERCFNPNIHSSIEQVIKALEDDGSAFALKTIQTIESKSPLSVKLNWSLLNKSKSSSIHESLTRDIKLAGKLMTNYKQNDFNQFISHKLINKQKDLPKSSHFANVSEVPNKTVDELISLDVYSPDESVSDLDQVITDLNNLKISKFESLSDAGGDIINDFIEYPHQMGLPSQNEVQSFISDKGDVSFADVVNYFRVKYDDKAGVSYKVKMILNRKTKKNNEILEWIN